MLTHRRLPASLSVVSLDLPVRTAFQTFVTLYQRAPQRFHILIDVPPNGFGNDVPGSPSGFDRSQREPAPVETSSRLLWLEVGESRAIFTSQSKTGLSYRHMWERGTYGISRYWLNCPDRVRETADAKPRDCMRLRNFTRNFELERSDRPNHLRLEYELWSGRLKLGTYVLDLDIYA
ncbi:MAG: hypothetical protein ACFB9N_16730 [Geitlerinemataceae cyanobacterium]